MLQRYCYCAYYSAIVWHQLAAWCFGNLHELTAYATVMACFLLHIIYSAACSAAAAVCWSDTAGVHSGWPSCTTSIWACTH
jgi:hypothetical protein